MTDSDERAGVADLTIQSISIALGGTDEWSDADNMDAYVTSRAKDHREALYMAAAHCQGGHSEAGRAIAELLSVPFPLDIKNLHTRAIIEGFDTKKLWPWYPIRATRAIQ